MPEQKEKLLQTNLEDSLGFLAIFLVGLFIRFYGAAKINFTEFEAAYVLGIEEFVSFSPSILQNFVNKLVYQLPSYIPIAYRLLSIFAGSFIILLPYFLRKKIGNCIALGCAFFFAFDPFLIADSILISGNTFVLLAAGLLIVAWIDEKLDLVSLLLFFLTMMGRGFAYFIIAFNLFLLLTSSYPTLIVGIKSGLLKLKSLLADRKNLASAALILIIIFLISSTRLDIFVADLSTLFANLDSNYPPGNSPFIYPLALLVYIPMGLVFAFLSLFLNPFPSRKMVKLAMTGSGLFLFFIMVFPGHRVVDLVWVSAPLWVVGAIGITHFFDWIKPKVKNSLVFITLLFVSMGNLILSILSLSYRYRFGLGFVNTLAAIFTIVVFIITLVIYWAYIRDIKTALGGLGITISIFLLLFQFSAASHTAAFSNSPEREIFWDGYYLDKPFIDSLIGTSVGNQSGSMAPAEIWVDKDISPDIFWDLSSNQITKQIAKEEPQKGYLVLLKSDEGTINYTAPYLGQKFIAKSYPAWMDTPLKSLMGNDFWSWLLFRDSQQHNAYNYLWINSGSYP
jgi:hypothetical protein